MRQLGQNAPPGQRYWSYLHEIIINADLVIHFMAEVITHGASATAILLKRNARWAAVFALKY
jgi:hypothetical protein